MAEGYGVPPNMQHAAQMLYQMQLQMQAPVPPYGIPGADQSVLRTMLQPADAAPDELEQEGVEESVSNEVFSSYKHWEILPGCKPHPADIVEAGSLSALPLPKPWYPLGDVIPKEVITETKLSSLQLEGVLYACQRHQLVLPNGNRAGFFMGDGAGVGKGRQISGLILDNFARGRTRHVWFSISSDLIVDARRDLGDIGCHLKVIEGCQQLDRETKVFGLPSDFKEGIMFSTYATLVSSVQKGGTFSSTRQSRLQQLVNWCGGNKFQGCLIFDECHKAKNFIPGKETASTKIAISVAAIQNMLPGARVVYCSATGVTDVKNMAFMSRLGLWGEGAPFKSFETFLETVHAKGLGIAEMLAMEMKSGGMYVSRGLSFRQTEFMSLEVNLNKDQIQMYDVAAHLWNEVRKALEFALERTGSTNSRVWSGFWGAHQRFFKQMCLGIKVPAIIQESEKALAEGQCVVVGLQTTGEASLENEVNKNGPKVTSFVSLCREILTRFVKLHFPTVIEGKTSENGQAPVEDEWSLKAKDRLLSYAKQIKLPNSPLDEIIDRLGGPDKVAEMTGRRGRIVRRSIKNTPTYELRGTESINSVDSLNVQERNMFMEGKKLVAIISDAASTGISLHADLRAGNQRRRVHLTFELPWSADKAVQQLGRSHRSNQSSGPLYKLMTTNLGGERRFASAVACRLQSLGALTKGDRRAATGADLGEFNFDTPYGRAALKTMYSAICARQLVTGVSLEKVAGPGVELEEFNVEMQECLLLMGLMEVDTLTTAAKVKDKDGHDVSKFLNRILGLSVSRQNKCFNYFVQCLEVHIGNAKKEGRYNEGLVDITASSVDMLSQPKPVFSRIHSSCNPTYHVMLNVDRGMTWEQALVRLKNHEGGKHNSFYCSRRAVRHQKLYILATQKDASSHLYKIARPNTGVSSFEEEYSDLLQKYEAVSHENAEAGWKELFENSKDRCMHGPNCKNGKTCSVGSRCYRIHLLCGGIVNLMPILELAMTRYGPRLNLTKAESTLRVVRALLNSGERVVGIRYPEMLIPLAEKMIQEQTMIQMAQQKLMTGMDQTTAILHAQNELQKPVIKPMEEPVSPVIARFLEKAITPPVTIKNFFKPITKSSAATLPVQPNKVAEKTVQNGSSNRATSISTSSNTASTQSNNDTDNDCEVIEQVSKGRKRSAEDESETSRPSVKRVKQANLNKSFSKQKQDKETAEKKKLSCPICGVKFPPGTWNGDINKHVDNCLIE